jgi:hypothetical protein
MKESLKVLQECADLQLKKSNDYQNPNSNIVQADYYPRGVATILDTVYGKILRMYSVLEAMEHDKDYNPNFESLEDSAKDLINYSSFIVAYIRGEVEGQSNDRDFLNRKVEVKSKQGTWDSFFDNVPPMEWAADDQVWPDEMLDLTVNNDTNICEDPDLRVNGVPYTINSDSVYFRGFGRTDSGQILNTEPTYIGDNHWLRSDGTTFENAHRPKPKDAK